MTFYKFTPDLMSKEDLERISVGGQSLIKYVTDKILKSISTGTITNIVFIGPRGVGKSHLLLRILNSLNNTGKITPIRLSEEEYSITTLEGLFTRILETGNVVFNKDDVVSEAMKYLKKKYDEKKPIVVLVENLQMLFDQMHDDLPRLRTIIQEDGKFFIIGSALTTFDEITSPDEPFYKSFEVHHLSGLSEEETEELINKRLILAGKEDLAKTLYRNKDRIKGIRILTGGNPRLIHILCEIIVQKNTMDDLEKNLLQMLDQLTPFYQARMETISTEKRKIFDTLALSDGPISPKEIAGITGIKITIVVAQLHILQNEGLVESIKFTNKKGIRYQISERLYRIWRELRTNTGPAKIRLFVDFLKLWYSTDELLDEYYSLSKELDELIVVSKKDPTKHIKQICYLLKTLPEISIANLPNTVVQFMNAGKPDYAKQEIDRVRKEYVNIGNPFIKKGIQAITLWAESLIERKNLENYQKQLNTIINEMQKIVPKNNEENTSITHQLSETIAEYLIANNDYSKAAFFNKISVDFLSNDTVCLVALNQQIRINLKLNKYDEIIKISNKLISEYTPESEDEKEGLLDTIKNRMLANMYLENKEESLRDSKTMIESSVVQIMPGILPHLKFKLYDDAIKIVSDNLTRLQDTKKQDREEFLRSYVATLLHSYGHLLMENRNDEKIFLEKLLNIPKSYYSYEMILNTVGYSIARFLRELKSKERVKIISEFFDLLSSVFGDEALKLLAPLKEALDYVKHGEVNIFETMHKEKRQLVINMIKDISPETEIPKIVYESLRD